MNISLKQLSAKIENYLDSGTADAKVTKVLLAIIAVALIAGVAVTAPNIFTIFKKRKSYKRFSNKQYHDALNNLKRSGYIKRDPGDKIHITSKGSRQLQTIYLDDINIIKPKKWDGKWRLFIFDIPIRFKKGRNALRWKIKDMGFLQYQKSVWIYPYPCEKEINFVSEFFGVTNYVDLLTVDQVAREQEFKKKFKI